MYAVIRSGNKQYRVQEGALVDVERLPVGEGESVEINQVLLVGDGDKTVIGQPIVEGASVSCHRRVAVPRPTKSSSSNIVSAPISAASAGIASITRACTSMRSKLNCEGMREDGT